MNILLATSEVVPFSQTGGLADVSASLPVELARLGHDVAVIVPAYRQAMRCGQPMESLGLEVEIPIGAKTVSGSLLRGTLPGSQVPVYLVRQDEYYDRDGLYGTSGPVSSGPVSSGPDSSGPVSSSPVSSSPVSKIGDSKGGDYKDNCERFVFFCRAVMEAARLLDLKVDVLHANDWQTALTAAYLATEYRAVPAWENAASLFTIHNLSFQGTFWHWDMLLTGLDWKFFNWHQMEFFGNLNLMKTGLVFADALSTVSPRYAEEIQSAPLGCGLEGVLQQRRNVLTGIVNGADYRRWNPATDPHLAMCYGPGNVEAGKAAGKAALQAQFGLPQQPSTPLVGFIGRLTDQKGLDLITGVIGEWVNTHDVQWVILGTGEPKYHTLLRRLAERYPHRVAVKLEFDDPVAHRIEAGADLFLMPSRYEPCGLNQLYSLKYGTVPVVRATGGLVDTITDATEEALAAGTANGYAFRECSVLALAETLDRAIAAFRTKPDVWRRLIATGMNQDWSWTASARQYVDLYQRITSRRRQPVVSA